MQKDLAEKLKKIPLLNKGTGSSSVATSVTVQGPVSSVTTAIASGPSSSSVLPSTSAAAASMKPPAGGVAAVPGLASISNLEAVKRAQELAAKMGFRQDPQFAPLINLFPGQVQADTLVPQKPTKAPVLRVDALGREIDEHGNLINATKPSNLSTLKVNINKQKKDAFQILKPEVEVDAESNPHFDVRMGINKDKLLRPKRMTFQFVEEGKWSKDAEIIKLKSQFGEAKAKELKAKQAQLAKAKAKADINPNLIEVSERITKEKLKDPIPEIEWWDLPILVSGSYDDIADDGVMSKDKLKKEKITIYIEHPKPIEPPAEPAPPPPQPLKLTKKEQKKLRTQRRLAREKDKQEMIRQGLIEPPKPKVKLSNLMKVLGSEATQDPTKLEMEIRSAAAEREQAHVDRNIARKLTPAERREKKERKLFDDPNTVETIVSVYRINDLSHPKTRFKVDVNAQENRLTGCAVISEGISVVVVEGGSKSIKRYGKLMLRRINWAEAVNDNDDDGDEDEEKPPNKCVLVWQGSVAKSSFSRFSVHECITEAAARKVLADAGVGHYWDLAVNFSDDEF
ncbi:protein RDM16-like isoform X2 [Gossypium arboreum]|nr:protein RDM16-like isoform X2 [Gossypium arboreum]